MRRLKLFLKKLSALVLLCAAIILFAYMLATGLHGTGDNVRKWAREYDAARVAQ